MYAFIVKLQDNKTPLQYAVETGHYFAVEVLATKGASVDCVDKVGYYNTN